MAAAESPRARNNHAGGGRARTGALPLFATLQDP